MLLIELTGDDGLNQGVPSSASLNAMLEVLSKLLRSTRPVVPGRGSMQQRRALEGTEEREAQLHRLQVNQQDCPAAQMPGEREARLCRLRVNGSQRIAAETHEREA